MENRQVGELRAQGRSSRQRSTSPPCVARPGRPGRHRSRALAAHADAIADLARQTMVALGGAGASAALTTWTGAHLLDQDPVSAAETMDRAQSGSGHTSAPSGPP
jgi:hypothetical protein